jgi:methionine-rich copper-binding protein CopC
MKSTLILRRALSSLAIAALAVFAPISSASAHTELTGTSPSADSDVNASQESISITFSEPPLVDGAAIVVMNEAGDILDSPAPTLDGSSLTIPWPADLTPGKVIVQWRASADDGHVQSGEFTFNYTAAAESGPAPTVTELPSASAEPMMTALGTPEVVAMPLAAGAAESGPNTLVMGVAILALVGLVAAGLYMRRSK